MASVNACVATHHQRMLVDAAEEREEVGVYFRNLSCACVHLSTVTQFGYLFGLREETLELGYANEAQ